MSVSDLGLVSSCPVLNFWSGLALVLSFQFLEPPPLFSQRGAGSQAKVLEAGAQSSRDVFLGYSYNRLGRVCVCGGTVGFQ